MQVKLFNTRIDADTIVADQQAINSFMETVTVKNTATQFVTGSPDFWSILIFYENGEEVIPKKSKSSETVKTSEAFQSPEIVKTPEGPEAPLSEEENQILLALKTWRKDKANEMQQPEFMVFSNATLQGLAKAKPRKLTDLNQIKGIGEAKITRYGDDLMAILNAF
jgi:superfamily II DNA helicase RecQ